MDISEYQPPPPRPSPPEPPRKGRSKLIVSALFVVAFLVTLDIANRNEIAQHFLHATPSSPVAPTALAETPKQPQTVANAPSQAQHDAANTLQPLPAQTSQAAENSPFK